MGQNPINILMVHIDTSSLH